MKIIVEELATEITFRWYYYDLLRLISILDCRLRNVRRAYENPDLTEKLLGERGAWRHHDSARRRPRRFLTHGRHDEKDSTIRREEGWPPAFERYRSVARGNPEISRMWSIIARDTSVKCFRASSSHQSSQHPDIVNTFIQDSKA